MRTKLIAGNWKMNCLKEEGIALAREIFEKATAALPVEILVCPPMSLLAAIAALPRHAAVGSQDVSAAPKAFGAYTGEVSAEMARDTGAAYALVGHSERRTLYGETDAVVHAKAQRALQAGLIPVICIGETEAERDGGRALAVVSRQIADSVPAEAAASCVIAYEPVWAIGTGKVPTTADIAAVHATIRQKLADKFGASAAAAIRILYGGSVKPSNAKEILGIPDVDGALIGGASLKSADFWAIAETQINPSL